MDDILNSLPDGLSRLSWIDVLPMKRWEARSVYAVRYGVDTLTTDLWIRRLQQPREHRLECTDCIFIISSFV